MDAPGRRGRSEQDDRDAALRARLEADGIDPDAAGDDGALVAEAVRVAGELVLGRDAQLSTRQVAERAGVPLAEVVGMFHDLGVAAADVDAQEFTDDDVAFVRMLRRAGEVGIERGDALLRVVAGALERITEAAVAVYVQGPERDLRDRGATLRESARTNMLATELALDLGSGLGAMFRHHMRRAVARQRVIQEGVSRREMARVAIGFVDLVGSTVLQSTLDPAALGDQVSRFEARAFDITAAGGGRIVKFIGDEIMVAAADPAAGARIVGDLVAEFTDDDMQPPRGGLVFGEVLFRHGDYYGPVVNLAARLAAAAIPGEALVDGSVVEALRGDGELRFEPAGRRMLKGFAGPVSVWSLVPGS